MKTIDLLVQELPALGGFPEGAVEAGFLCNTGTLYFVNKEGNCPSEWRISMNYEVEDGWVEVTREQYEAALAEKEHPLPWDEKKKPCPTLGAECRGYPDCGRRVSCTSDDITDDAVRAEIGMNSRALDAALAANNDGWIEWGGGLIPISTNTFVDVKFNNGDVRLGKIAGEYSWEHVWEDSNIIAYRLHKPQEVARADDESDLNECIGQDAAPVWSGEGLPPVGVECEVSVDGGRSWCTYRAINENNGARLIEIGNFTEEFQNNNWIFRPIRSEAVRKREEAVKAITLTGWCQTAAEEIYDLIAAGKVPGMKLED